MSTAAAPPSPARWWICILLLLASALNYMDRQALSQTAVRVSGYFELSNEDFGTLDSAFNIGFALGAISVGWLVDRGNVRLIYPAIVILWSAAGFAAGFAEKLWFLMLCRFALGLFEAGNIPCGVLTVKRVLRTEERALGNGMFQSGSALGAIITPWVVLLCVTIVEQLGSADKAFAWQFPFRVVGTAGLVWAALWLLTVKSHQVRPAPIAVHETGDNYWAIFRNRRFWVALAVVISINSAWRSFGYWLPKYLQQEKKYGETEMTALSSGFFVSADLGSVAVGAAVLWLARRGMSLSRARLLCYIGCAGLTATSIVVAVLPKGFSLVVVLLLLGFGSLGLFPIYYAMSQEISARHQGKVTGTLSFLNAIYLAGYIKAQGRLWDLSGSFALPLGAAGVIPLFGLVALALWWNDPQKRSSAADTFLSRPCGPA
jgi:ACS family hexuronate transporter-like MFS transporter